MKFFATAVLAANPIRRVVTLLQDLQKEIETEGKKEADLYQKFQCYCTGNTDNLSKSGEEAAAQIELLSAKISEETSEKGTLKSELDQHKKDRQEAKQALQQADKIRKKENQEYNTNLGETKSNLESISKAITALEKGASALLQSDEGRTIVGELKSLISTAKNIESEDREAVDAFLQAGTAGDYQPQGGQIIGILKNMKDELDKGLNNIVSDEEADVATYNTLKAAKQKELTAASSAVEAKGTRSGELAVSIVQSEGMKEDATRELNDVQKFIANLATVCKEKAADYEVRTKTRNEEVHAISEAIKVLNDDDALDLFKNTLGDKKTVSLLELQSKSTQSMSFLRGNERKADVKTVKALMKKIASSSLNASGSKKAVALLAHTVNSKLGVKVDFSKVVKMIEDMQELLKREQKDDEKHKEFCDAEFDSSNDEQKEIERKLATVKSSISEIKDEIKILTEEVFSHNSEVKALDESVAEASEQRKTEHQEYVEKVQLNSAAISLIGKAKNKLNTFYNPNLVAEKPALTQEVLSLTQTSFIQLHAATLVNAKSTSLAPPPPPETYGEFKPKSQKSNGVLALLDMLVKDLEKETQETEHIEKTATRDYETLVADATAAKNENSRAISDKNASLAALEVKSQEQGESKIVTHDGLDQVKNYISDLHQSCDFIIQHFDVRREARTNEIESLNNAKAVLGGADYK